MGNPAPRRPTPPSGMSCGAASYLGDLDPCEDSVHLRGLEYPLDVIWSPNELERRPVVVKPRLRGGNKDCEPHRIDERQAAEIDDHRAEKRRPSEGSTAPRRCPTCRTGHTAAREQCHRSGRPRQRTRHRALCRPSRSSLPSKCGSSRGDSTRRDFTLHRCGGARNPPKEPRSGLAGTWAMRVRLQPVQRPDEHGQHV